MKMSSDSAFLKDIYLQSDTSPKVLSVQIERFSCLAIENSGKILILFHTFLRIVTSPLNIHYPSSDIRQDPLEIIRIQREFKVK